MTIPARKMYENCYGLLSYIMSGRKFTVRQISEHLEISRRQAVRHLDTASIYFPIIEVTPPYYGEHRGRSPAVYQYTKELFI